MLICLGGFLGSGRRILARKLAERHRFHLYDIGSKKIRRHVFKKNGRVKEVALQPNTEELRLFLYQRIIEDFPRVSKMYPDTIVNDEFHREMPREYFLSEARKYFDPVVFIWIDSDEIHAKGRLRHMVEIGMLPDLGRALKGWRRATRTFDPPKPDTRMFRCVNADNAEAEELWALIQTPKN